MSTDRKVLEHFHEDAARFDAIYEDSTSPVRRFVDHVWRGVVRRRLDLAVERLQPLAGKTILDVGCGSGRFGIAFARAGAKRTVGVDFAPAMIAIAGQLAERAGVAAQNEFRVGAFPEAVPEGGFDASVAMGFFDYIEDPLPVLKAMRERTDGTVLMSFPKSNEWRVPIRRLRFKLAGCPLFLYSERRVRDLLAAAGMTDYDWIELDRDWVVAARTGRAR